MRLIWCVVALAITVACGSAQVKQIDGTVVQRDWKDIDILHADGFIRHYDFCFYDVPDFRNLVSVGDVVTLAYTEDSRCVSPYTGFVALRVIKPDRAVEP